jgi:hypothetical protein
VLLIDAIVVKIRDGQVANRPIYVAMGINLDGERDVLAYLDIRLPQIELCELARPVVGSVARVRQLKQGPQLRRALNFAGS